MTISAASKRLAATGVATALATGLATGALVAGTAGTATAAVSGGATYSCAVPGTPIAFDFPLTLSAPNLPTQVPADFPVPGGLVPVVGTLGLPAELTGFLAMIPGLEQLSAGLPGFKMLLGATPVPLEGLASQLAPITGGTDLAGKVGSFTTPDAGTLDLTLPASFVLAPLGNVPLPIATLDCTLKEGEDRKVGSVEVTKQTAALGAKAVKKGKAVKATVTRQQTSTPAAGKVAVFVKNKKVATKALRDGKAVLKLTGVKASKVVVKYLGNGSTTAAKKTVKLK